MPVPVQPGVRRLALGAWSSATSFKIFDGWPRRWCTTSRRGFEWGAGFVERSEGRKVLGLGQLPDAARQF